MNEPRTIKGRWWIHGRRKKPHFGILQFSPTSGIELEVSIAERMSLVDIFSGKPGRNRPIQSRIQGEDQKGKPVTLFGCSAGRKAEPGLETFQIKPSMALLNRQARGWNSTRFRHAKIRFRFGDEWLSRYPSIGAGTDNPTAGFPFKRHPDITLAIDDQADLRISQSWKSRQSVSEQHFEVSNSFWFHFRRPLAAPEILSNYAAPLQRLLCLLSGENMAKEKIEFYTHSPFEKAEASRADPAELLMRSAGNGALSSSKSAHRMRMTFPDVSSNFAEIVKLWYQKHQILQPVVDLYFGVIVNSELMFETQFLYFAQALEVYHARCGRFAQVELDREAHRQRVDSITESAPREHQGWVREKLAFSNQKTLAQRLGDIAAEHPRETGRLTAKLPQFLETVRHTRNYYTHYSSELLKRGKVAQDETFLRMTFAMQALLEICLLSELGITGEPIENILRLFDQIEFIPLDT